MPKAFVELYDRYATMLTRPFNMDKTIAEYAAELGVGRSTIAAWNTRLDWKEINEKRREAYGEIIHTVDSALLKRAQKGDAEAIKLFYARFDGYVPISGTIDLSDKKDDELRKRADEIKVEILGSRTKQDQPGISEARA
mgnify:FL=1